jgi:hypothetical protein
MLGGKMIAIGTLVMKLYTLQVLLHKEYCYKIILECYFHFIFNVTDPLICIAWSLMNNFYIKL